MGIEINDVDPRVQYVPIAAQVVFTIPFEFFEDDDVKIYFDDSTTAETSGFTIVGANSNGTKEVTFSTAPETSGVTKLTIERDTQVKRTTNFTVSSDWKPDNINNEYNRVTMMIGEREGEIGRSVVRPVQSSESYSLLWPDGATTSQLALMVTTSGLSLVDVATLGTVIISDLTPLSPDTAAAGTSTEVSRADHIHGMDQELLDFDAGLSDPAHREGRVFYDDTNKCLAFYNDEAEVTNQVGRELWIRSRNNTGSTISDAKAIYVSGASGNRPEISLAKADALTTARMVGIATHDIETASFGEITTFGLVNNVDTSAFSDGDTLYLSAATAGELTATPPTGADFDIVLGTVLNAHATQGKILVNVGQDIVQRASQAEAEAGTDNTKMMTPLSAAQAIAALVEGSKIEVGIIIHTSDTALATKGSGGSQLGAAVSMTVPAAGVIKITMTDIEIDETEGNSATAVFGIKVGSDAIIWPEADAATGTTNTQVGIQINASVSSVVGNDNLYVVNGDTAFHGSHVFDIVKNSISTGVQDIEVWASDNAGSRAGEVTVTGTTVPTRFLIEIIDGT